VWRASAAEHTSCQWNAPTDISGSEFAARRLADFEARAKVTTWLFRIALHAARDLRRRAPVRREVLDTTALEHSVEPATDATTLLERRDDLALFDDALDAD
jgi:DNA-directed RNA polymerase specialized sigma24 family protein